MGSQIWLHAQSPSRKPKDGCKLSSGFAPATSICCPSLQMFNLPPWATSHGHQVRCFLVVVRQNDGHRMSGTMRSCWKAVCNAWMPSIASLQYLDNSLNEAANMSFGLPKLTQKQISHRNCWRRLLSAASRSLISALAQSGSASAQTPRNSLSTASSLFAVGRVCCSSSWLAVAGSCRCFSSKCLRRLSTFET